jgi:hypothetical protein
MSQLAMMRTTPPLLLPIILLLFFLPLFDASAKESGPQLARQRSEEALQDILVPEYSIYCVNQ